MESSKHKKHEKGMYMEHQQHTKNQNYKTATWVLGAVSVVLLVLFVVSLTTGGFGGASSGVNALSASEIKAKSESYVQGLAQGQTVSVNNVKDEGDLYVLDLTVAGQPYTSYVRKDGSLLFVQGLDMTQTAGSPSAAAAQPQPTNVPKSDKPVVELFVMSHCPYGTQAEKGILPVVRTLGDKIDFKVRFVYYAMHGKTEVDEQLNQYCIQKEQPTVYLKYLACFLNASDGPGCLTSTGVDTAKMSACTTAADSEFGITTSFNDQASWLSGRFPLFNTDKDLNTKYSVGGSPTLVINGVQSNAGRSPSSFMAGICGAFNNAPSECQTQVDATTPGPGFGYDSVGQAAAAGCIV